MKFNSCIVSIYLALILLSTNVLARGRSARPKPTAENEITACLENQHGMAIITRKALYAVKNILGDRMDSIQWPEFCQCFGPQHFELNSSIQETKKQQDWYQKYESQRDVIVVNCANSHSAGKREIPPIVSPPSATSSQNNKFNLFIEECTKSPNGRLMNVQIHLQGQNNPRAKKALSMDPKKYCSCYTNYLRRNLGDDLAMRELTTMNGVNDSELFKVRNAINGAYETCAKEQIPF